MPRHGDYYWHELASPDPEASEAFYTGLLGWKARRMNGPFEYTVFMQNGTEHGGMVKMEGEAWKGVSPHWMIYIKVDDIDDAVDKAVALGGSVEVPPTEIPDMGRFSVIRDPQGAVFSVMQPIMQSIE